MLSMREVVLVLLAAVLGWAVGIAELALSRVAPGGPVILLADENDVAFFLGADAEQLGSIDTVVIGAGHLIAGSDPIRDGLGSYSYEFASPQLMGGVIGKGHRLGKEVFFHVALGDRRGRVGLDRAVMAALDLERRTGLDGAIIETRRAY